VFLLATSEIEINRGGGASMVGTQTVATAAPDGQTIGIIDSAFVINPALFRAKLPYDTKKNFAPISLSSRSRRASLCGRQ
jgi:tripartite-type tricarboxylate transporter receptor subunit TctC